MRRTFFAALSVLSALPLGGFTPTEGELKRSIDLFPLAGAFFGLIFFLFAWGLYAVMPPLAAALFLVLLAEGLTRGLHLDGFADCADALFSSRSRERKLEIMRDSRVGVMGAAGVFALLGLKFAFLASLPAAFAAPALGLALLNGRAGLVFYVALGRPARPDGLGAFWFATRPAAGVLVGALLSLGVGWAFFGAAGTALPLLLAFAAWGWSAFTNHALGGGTGDTIGAFEEASELLTLGWLACALFSA